MMKREHAYLLKTLIHKASASLSDEDALSGIELFPLWAVGQTYTIGERVRYGEKLYKVLLDHTSQADWTPDIAVSLYVEVSVEEIPVWKQPTGAQDAYNKGDKVWYPEKDTTVYESLIDANVYSPEAYPQGWKEVV